MLVGVGFLLSARDHNHRWRMARHRNGGEAGRHKGHRGSFEPEGSPRREGHGPHEVESGSGLGNSSRRRGGRVGSDGGNLHVVDYSLEQGGHGDHSNHQGGHHSYLHDGVANEIYTGHVVLHLESVGELGQSCDIVRRR